MKICTKCKKQKEESEFAWKLKAKNKLQSHCKECQNTLVYDYKNYKAYYIANARKQNKKIKARNRQWIYQYKLSHPCKCGESDPACLDFHHAGDNKEKNVSILVNSSSSIKTIENEINKCIVLCSNCHRKKHARMVEWQTQGS